MKPDTDYLVQSLATYIASETIPQMDSAHSRANLGLAVRLFFAAAMNFDNAAARLIEENKAIRKIFGDAAGIVADEDLGTALSEAAQGFDTDYRVSELDKTNQVLRALFIDLHAHLETLDGEPARLLEASIWQELSASVQRRLPALVGMATAGAILEQHK